MYVCVCLCLCICVYMLICAHISDMCACLHTHKQKYLCVQPDMMKYRSTTVAANIPEAAGTDGGHNGGVEAGTRGVTHEC